MCLIAVNWSPGSDTPLTLLGNRDEFFNRPTSPLFWWEGARVLAGRDLKEGGTWLGVTISGRMAAITNFRTPKIERTNKPSRGSVVKDFLTGSMTAVEYGQFLQTQAHVYNPFNLLLFDGVELMGFESRSKTMVMPKPGVFAISNADFDTPWPKLVALKAGLRRSIFKYESTQPSDDELLALLADQTVSPDHLLPATGVPLDRERALSSAFVKAGDYGTRASSLIRFWDGRVTFVERRFDVMGLQGESNFTFNIAGT